MTRPERTLRNYVLVLDCIAVLLVGLVTFSAHAQTGGNSRATVPPEAVPDWLRVTLVALVIPTLGVLWIWVIRPFLSAGVWHLIEQRPDKKVEFFLSVLENKDQHPRLQKISEAIFGERIGHVDREIAKANGVATEALELARSNRDAIDGFLAMIKAQGAVLDDMRKSVSGIPQLAAALERWTASLDVAERSISDMQITIARMDERQQSIKEMVERRNHQINPHPTRRADDRQEDQR